MGGSRVKDMWGMGSGGVGSRVGVVGLTLDYLKSEMSFVFREKKLIISQNSCFVQFGASKTEKIRICQTL